MRTLILSFILTQLSGCVVYTAHFEPGKANTVCLNVTVCKQEP